MSKDSIVRYKDYTPTGFDPAGAFLPDRQEWLVLPVGRNRDTESPRQLSNFDVALRMLGGERRCVEVHRFNHWACGWFEIILAHPWLRTRVQEIYDKLEGSEVLDWNDYEGRREEEEEEEDNHVRHEAKCECGGELYNDCGTGTLRCEDCDGPCPSCYDGG